MPMVEPFLRVEGLCKSYGGLTALEDVGLTLEAGGFLCLFGPNGAGKSTLLKVLATLLPPTAGSVRVAGFDLEEHPEAFRAQLGLVSHQSFLYDDLSARENLAFYAALYGVPDPSVRAGELLERVDLAHRAHSPVREFSRGMQQRLSIARALVNDPSLLLLDEPYTGLDAHAAIRLSRQLRLLHEARRTIVMATHNLERGLDLATSVGILARGKVVFLQRRDQIDPEAFEQLYFRHLEAA